MSDKISISTQEIDAEIVTFDAIIAKNDEVLNLIATGLQTLMDAGMMTISASAIAKIKNLKRTIERENQILNDGKTALINSRATYENLDVSLRKMIENTINNGGEDIYGAKEIEKYPPSTQIVENVVLPKSVERNGSEYMCIEYTASVLSQNDYDGPEFGYGRGNGGCTATAWCMGLKMLYGGDYDPRSTQYWTNGSGATWKDPYGSVSENVSDPNGMWGEINGRLITAYQELQDGRPAVFYGYHNWSDSPNSEKSYHAVTIVGLKEGTDPNNLTMNDFLVVDPWGGEVKSLAECRYIGLDNVSVITYPKPKTE